MSTQHDVRQILEQALGASYTFTRELGGGGMSRLFLAEERALGRRVVIKVLAPEVAHELSAERFAREIQLSAQLQHPNIVPVLTAGVAGVLPYYTMPFVEGESLRSHIGRLSESERMAFGRSVDVLRDVLKALAYAHRAGVIHRDIKPENVLLVDDAAVVADFGVAKAVAVARVEGIASSATLTRAGVSIGTPAYMSPEQVAGDPNSDHRSDLYAWGVLAYELIAGAHPFAHRRSMQELVTAHVAEQPVQLTVPGVPDTIAALVMQCLQKNPADRPSSARDVLEALGSAHDHSSRSRHSTRAVAAPVEAASVAAPSRRSRPLLRATIAGVSMVAVAGIAWFTRGTRAEPESTARVANSPAMDAYLRGKVRISSENPADNDAAIAALREATARDGAFAPAYAELSRALTIKAFYFAPDSARKRLNEDAEVALAKALSLDSRLGAAYLAQGLMLWSPARRFPHEQAVRAYRKALELDSTLDEAHHQLGLVYLHVGLLSQAQAEVEKALEINPGNTLAHFRRGVVALYRNDFERAHALFNTTPPERNPALWGFQAATVLFRLNRIQEAEDLLDRMFQQFPNDQGGVGHSVRAMMRAKAGHRREAEAEIAAAIETGRNFGHFHHTAYTVASAYALLGEQDQALRWLKDAAESGFPCYPLFATDTHLDRLRNNPRFQSFMAQLKRDWEERVRTL